MSVEHSLGILTLASQGVNADIPSDNHNRTRTIGAATTIRTLDLLITNESLYHLSYGGSK